jgi:hypothetical protein
MESGRASPKVCQILLCKSCILPTSKKGMPSKKRVHLQQFGIIHLPNPDLRACLGGLRLHQTSSGAATPPICSSTVELDSPFGVEEMCLAETTTPAPKNEDLN